MFSRHAVMAGSLAAVLAAVTVTPDHPEPAWTAISDVSSAKKKQKARPRVAAPPPPGVWRGWRPADPSFDQYGRPYRPPPGLDCPVDLGYGRWGSCNFEN